MKEKLDNKDVQKRNTIIHNEYVLFMQFASGYEFPNSKVCIKMC